MARTIIVVPCFNEANRLPADRFRQYAQHNPDCQFLFVNDGSTDETGPILQALQDEAPDSFRTISLERNSGKAEAVRSGVLHAFNESREFVGYWDADLATPLEAIDDLLKELVAHPDVDLAMGARVQLIGRKIHRRAMRHYMGRLFATAASMVLGISVYDTQCGAKLFRPTTAIRSAFEEPFLTRWIFDVELLARYLDALDASGQFDQLEPVDQFEPGAKIHEVPLLVWADISGSKIRPKDMVRAAFDLARIRRQYRRALRRR